MANMMRDSKSGRFIKSERKICKIPECQNQVRGKGFCNKHLLRFQRYGDPYYRKKAANGEGGIGSHGYKVITINGQRILEHRYIMENFIGRELKRDEIIHHIDGNKLNNACSNLKLTTRKDHVLNDHPQVLENLKLGPQVRWGTFNANPK